MKRLLLSLLAALALLGGQAQAAPSRVQTCTAGSSNGVGNATSVCASLTAGSTQLIIAVVTAQVNIANFGGPTGAGAGCGGTPNMLYRVSNGTTPAGLAFWSIAIAGGGGACTVTYVPNGSGQPIAVVAVEVTGSDATSAPNDGNGVSTNFTSFPCTCTVTMSATGTANDILFAIAVSPSAANFDFSLDTPQGTPAWSYLGGTGTGLGASTNIAFGVVSAVVSVTGTPTAGWSTITQQSGGGGREVFVGAIAIKGASGGGGGGSNGPFVSPIQLGVR